MRARLLAALVLTAAALTSCGGNDDENAGSGDAASEENCIILANGNKLCGEDAKAYCERFAVDAADPETARACIAVGADVTSARADREAAELEQEEQEAAQERGKIRAASQFKRAVRSVVDSDDLLVVKAEPAPADPTKQVVRVETFYERNVRQAKLQQICDAVHAIDARTYVQVISDDYGPVLNCAPKTG